MYDITIIGAGVVGCSIARELSRYSLKICVLEKGYDVATEASKANSGIVHAGYDPKPGTLKALLNIKGNRLYDQLSDELDFHFKRNGSLTVAFEEQDRAVIEKLYENGVRNGVSGLKILSPQELFNMEPNLNKSIIAALYAPSGGITCPYDMTWALAENAALNGVEFFLGQEVTAITKNTDNSFLIKTPGLEVTSRYVINAAGVYADEVSAMAGAEEFSITPRKGEYCLLDKECGSIVSSTIFSAPGKMGKGILVTPTVDGNVLIGPTAVDVSKKTDVNTTGEGMQMVVSNAVKMVPDLPVRSVITSFAGLRAISGDDFIIEASTKVPGFVQVAGICSPGLTAAPAIGEYVRDILSDIGLELKPNSNFNPIRKSIPRFRELDHAQRAELIKVNPQFGRIVCRCEMITEGEIVEAIRRPCGATNLDAVKRRIRAGMGRCQGGFCSAIIVDILSKELGVPKTGVTKNGGESLILLDKIR